MFVVYSVDIVSVFSMLGWCVMERCCVSVVMLCGSVCGRLKVRFVVVSVDSILYVMNVEC